MNGSADLQRKLVDYIARNSGHDAHRRYIGLSGIADCERVIYDRYLMGTPASVAEKLKTAISYDLEGYIIDKLKLLSLYREGREIWLYDGLVRGHVDGIVGVDLLEIKTIERELWFPENRVPARAYYQVQAYMHYLGLGYAHIVYLARDTGAVRVYGIRVEERKGEEIEAKVARLVQAVQEVRRPECTCGRCVE